MHRRTLTLRRFGPLSFGLGYFEDGVWVDHSAPNAVEQHELPDGSELRPREEPMHVVHQWFTCCIDRVADVPATTQPHFTVVGAGLAEEALAISRQATWETPRAQTRASQR